jgi:hypothetical protein
MAELLRRELAGSLVEDPDVPGNLSIYAGAPRDGNARSVLRIYEGCSYLFTATTQERAIEVVRIRLQAFLPIGGRRADELLLLRMAAVLGGDQALLIPSALLRREPALERRLQRDHLKVHPCPIATVDSASHELRLLPSPSTSAYEVAGTRPVRRRYRIIGWAFETDPKADPPLTRAHAVARALTKVAQRPSSRELQQIAALMSGSAVIELQDGRREAAIRAAFCAST